MAGFQSPDKRFEGRQFDPADIVLCEVVVSLQASCRELVEMMAERGLSPVHTTKMRSGFTPPARRRIKPVPPAMAPGHGQKYVDPQPFLQQRTTTGPPVTIAIR